MSGAGQGDRSRLSLEKIIDKAIDLIEAEGAATFSMRRLARFLDVTPMALYRHIGGRSELLGFALDHLLNDLGKSDRSDAGGRFFAPLVQAYGAVTIGHPQLWLAYLADQEALSCEAERVSSLMSALLILEGHDPQVATILRDIVVDHTHGYLLAYAASRSSQNMRTALDKSYERASQLLLSRLAI